MTQGDAPPRCPACGYPLEAPPCPRCGGTIHDSEDGTPVRTGTRFPLRDLIQGFVALFLGSLWLLHRREYRGRLTLPILANIVALSLTLLLFVFGLWELFEWLLGDWELPSWLVASAALVLALVALFLVAPILIEVVISPFLDPLAEATERAWAGNDMPAMDTGIWRSALIGVRASAQILAIQLLLLVPLLLLALVPGGILVSAAIAAWLNALVWFDVPCARRGYSLRERVALVRRNWARALGFGLAFQVGMMVPFFNILLLTPAAAVAASILYFQFDKSAPFEESRAGATVPRSTPPEEP